MSNEFWEESVVLANDEITKLREANAKLQESYDSVRGSLKRSQDQALALAETCHKQAEEILMKRGETHLMAAYCDRAEALLGDRWKSGEHVMKALLDELERITKPLDTIPSTYLSTDTVDPNVIAEQEYYAAKEYYAGKYGWHACEVEAGKQVVKIDVSRKQINRLLISAADMKTCEPQRSGHVVLGTKPSPAALTFAHDPRDGRLGRRTGRA